MNDNFWESLSGKVEYSEQAAAWENLCAEHDVDAKQVLGLLNRAYEAARGTK